MLAILLFIWLLISKGKDDATIAARVIEKYPNYKRFREFRGGERDLLKAIRQIRRRRELDE